MPPRSPKIPTAVYQFKITLKGSRPPIWRRVWVPDHFSLYKFHRVIQLAMGWEDGHLHQFVVDGRYYNIPHPDDWEPGIDERRIALEKLAPSVNSRFIYEYDFGDGWEHVILVEKIIPPEAGEIYPKCIQGKGACPPEDVGGIWGYQGFLQAIRDPNHEEHDSYLEWVGGEFDPKAFDIEAVNRALRKVK